MKMKHLDYQECAIVRELIKNPRVSDTSVSKKTKIPTMSVNRKRKKLEKEGFLNYYAVLNNKKTGLFKLCKLYIIKFKIGITASMFLETMENDIAFQNFNQEHIDTTYLSEKDGHFALVMIIDAENDTTLLEHFNGFIVPNLKKHFGEDAISEITTVKLHQTVRMHHSYMPSINIENG